MSKTSVACLLAVLSATALAQDGLQIAPATALQAQRLGERSLRLDLGALRMDLSVAAAGNAQPRARLLGDYYLTGPGFGGIGISGGLRLTGGLAIGPNDGSSLLPAARQEGGLRWAPRDAALPTDRPGGRLALPYIGVGYTTLSSEGGWGLSADIGLGGIRPGDSVRLGVGGPTAQQVDSILNSLRLAPLVQIGVSYAF